jgi:hypothetical protein
MYTSCQAGIPSIIFPNLSTPASKENKDTNLLDIIPNKFYALWNYIILVNR